MQFPVTLLAVNRAVRRGAALGAADPRGLGADRARRKGKRHGGGALAVPHCTYMDRFDSSQLRKVVPTVSTVRSGQGKEPGTC